VSEPATPLRKHVSWRDRAAEISPLYGFAAEDSTGGETGILETIFSAVPERAGFGVEFGQRTIGAGTLAELVARRGWGALYLDREAHNPETRTVPSGRTIKLARETVRPGTITDLFEKHDVPVDLDCLVIDIDGLDYWVWKKVARKYTPSLVVIEFNAHVPFGVNATIRPEEDWTYDGTRDYGASITALVALGARLGYRLVHVHGPLNLYFVPTHVSFPEELMVKAHLGESDLAVLADTEAFYDTFVGVGRRPTWFSAPPPNVSDAPWEIVAAAEPAERIDLEGLPLDVLAGKLDAAWYGQRKTFEEKASPLYELIHDEGFTLFVDVGANAGLISILARRAAPQIRVIAVEPDPRLADLTRRNFRIHQMEDARVVNAIAGRDAPATANFGLNPRSTLDNRVSADEWPQVRVPVVRMDAVLAGLERTGRAFLKIDTQGYELHVLQGMETWLAVAAGWVIKMEFAPDWLRSQGTDPHVLLEYLLERYEVVEYTGRVPFATKELEALFAAPLLPPQSAGFLRYVESLDRAGLGWVDLLVRPRGRPEPT